MTRWFAPPGQEKVSSAKWPWSLRVAGGLYQAAEKGAAVVTVDLRSKEGDWSVARFRVKFGDTDHVGAVVVT
ncbi:MAG: hypothetical protein U9R77_14815, partial [Pseudomonadota bacterium]|nr:hypothetical protein [Pseudomonadota bacterium]